MTTINPPEQIRRLGISARNLGYIRKGLGNINPHEILPLDWDRARLNHALDKLQEIADDLAQLHGIAREARRRELVATKEAT